MENLIAYITLFLKLLPALLAAGEQLGPLINRVTRLWTDGGVPTDEDWQILDDLNAKYTKIIQAPIPGEDTV